MLHQRGHLHSIQGLDPTQPVLLGFGGVGFLDGDDATAVGIEVVDFDSGKGLEDLGGPVDRFSVDHDENAGVVHVGQPFPRFLSKDRGKSTAAPVGSV